MYVASNFSLITKVYIWLVLFEVCVMYFFIYIIIYTPLYYYNMQMGTKYIIMF